MTPFDPLALLAMLQAFYPVVSAAALQQARAERPEYFAAGELFGSKGDKLRLPDGRVFDCIFAAGGPIGTQRWSVIDVTNDPGAVSDGLELEPGPLVPLDAAQAFPPFGDPGFEAFVAGELGGLGNSDAQLDAAREGAVAFTGADELDGEFRRLMEPAVEAHATIRAALDNDDPIDVIEATNNHDGAIDAARGDYVEDPPPDTAEPDPGGVPDDGQHGGDEEPPQA